MPKLIYFICAVSKVTQADGRTGFPITRSLHGNPAKIWLWKIFGVDCIENLYINWRKILKVSKTNTLDFTGEWFRRSSSDWPLWLRWQTLQFLEKMTVLISWNFNGRSRRIVYRKNQTWERNVVNVKCTRRRKRSYVKTRKVLRRW